MSLAKNLALLRHLPKVDGLRLAEFGRSADVSSPLEEVTGFGDNPGNLRMFAFVPAQLQKPRALVVVLHGCGQTAAAYDLGAGWSTLAKHYGFALVMPEQQRVNNGNTCFNWFNPEDTARDGGEARSIREMIAHMAEAHRIDPKRVFITGLSAGGGMTSVMLATYPEVFAAGAVIAGLALWHRVESARGAGRHVSFAGAAGARARRLRAACLEPSRAMAEDVGVARQRRPHRQSRQRQRDRQAVARFARSAGRADGGDRLSTAIRARPGGTRTARPWSKSYAITDMAHGTPLGLADNDQRYGIEGAFLIEAGISSSYHIAKFFGLTGWIPDAVGKKVEARPATSKPALSPAPHLARSIRAAVAEEPAEPKREEARGFDLGQIITRALTAAGLMK